MVENRSVDWLFFNYNVYGVGIIVLMKRLIKCLLYFEILGLVICEIIVILLNRFLGFD